MTRTTVSSISVLLLAAGLAGCSSGPTADPTAEGQADTVNTDDVAEADTAQTDVDEDVVTIGDVGTNDSGNDGCPSSRLIEAWPLNNRLAIGDGIEVTEADGVYTATIDAAAGGTQGVSSNAFVYLNLESTAATELTDTESLDATDWHLAFRRAAIRLNSGDSGPGQLELTRVSDVALGDVTSVPADTENWAVDATFSRTCEIQTDPIGTPITAMNELNGDNPSGSQSWYLYGADGVSPNPDQVYVVRDTASGAAWKFEIASWESGVYTLRWASLAP